MNEVPPPGNKWTVKQLLNRINEDPDALDGEEMADYIIYYEADNTDVAHALDVDLYSTDPDAPPNSWYLLVEVEDEQE